MNLLPILAPLLLAASSALPFLQYPAKAIYFIYSFTCHQFHHRSLHIYDHQCAWCSRDMGIWGGVFLGAVATRLLGIKQGLRWYWLILFTLPIALDGGIQTIAHLSDPAAPFYTSNNFIRFLTGSIFGVGLSLWVSPKFLEWLGGEYWEQAGWLLEHRPWKAYKPVWESLQRSMFKLSTLLIGILLMLYVIIVGIWAITSPNYPPSNLLDSEVKNSGPGFLDRRQNGICPTTGRDIFNFSCFFGD